MDYWGVGGAQPTHTLLRQTIVGARRFQTNTWIICTKTAASIRSLWIEAAPPRPTP